MKSLLFEKYDHIGNDFAIVDFFEDPDGFYRAVTPGTAVKLCDRNFGIGADGVIAMLPPDDPKNDFKMEIYNSDGSFATMCGNGLACLALFATDSRLASKKFRVGKKLSVETRAGMRYPAVGKAAHGGRTVTIDMGEPKLAPKDIPADAQTICGSASAKKIVETPFDFGGYRAPISLVSMGNPHCVIFAEAPLPRERFMSLGPMIEKHSVFPDRTNVEFVTVISKSEISVQVWERGAGPTLACGTGASACAFISHLTGRTAARVRVNLPGGSLAAETLADGRISLECRPEFVFSGEIGL